MTWPWQRLDRRISLTYVGLHRELPTPARAPCHRDRWREAGGGIPGRDDPPKPVDTQGAEREATQHGCSCPCSCPAAPGTLHRAPLHQSHRLGKGQSPPNLPKPHRTVLLLFLILFYNPRTIELSWKKKKKNIPGTSCTALPQWSPLRPTKNEDKLWMFICQFYFPPICSSLVCKLGNGERKWDASTFFLQLLQSLSSCLPGCRWSVIHTVTKPAWPHSNKIINQQAGSTEGFLQPKKNPRHVRHWIVQRTSMPQSPCNVHFILLLLYFPVLLKTAALTPRS